MGTVKELIDVCNLSTEEFEALIGAILPKFADEFGIDPNDEKFTVDDILANSEMSEMLVSSVVDWAKANKRVTAKEIADCFKINVIDEHANLPDMLNPDRTRLFQDTKTGEYISSYSAMFDPKRYKLIRDKLTDEQIEEKAAKRCVVKHIVNKLKEHADEIAKEVKSAADQVIPMPIINDNSDNGVTFAQAIKSPIAYAAK